MDAPSARTVVHSPAGPLGSTAAATVSDRLRRLRPEVADLVDRCRVTILTPDDDQGLSRPLRLALVARVALRCGATDLARGYRAQLEAPPLLPIADGAPAAALAAPRMGAIIDHADRLTLAPTDLDAAALVALETAGLSAGAIVALTQIVAFANFEARVAMGLAALAPSPLEPSA